MDPDKKKKFNFGTGEIDVDQWLQDIDAGLPDYYERMGKTYHNKENEEVRNAMTDLIGRISSGDMLSRSANGTYNFRSQLYSPNRGKYTKWAYQTALSYIGGKGRNLVTPPKQQEEEPTTTKNKYSTQTLIKRFNNSVQRGSTQLNLDNTWWGSASMDQKAKHLSEFLNKEAAYIRGTDIDDVDDVYKDLGKEGLATAMTTLASQILSNPEGDYGRQFGNIGITNLLRRPISQQQQEPVKVQTVDDQLQEYQNAETTRQKQIQLGWLKNKGSDTYFNNGYDAYQSAIQALNQVHKDRASGNDVTAMTKARQRAHPNDPGILGAVVSDLLTAETNYKNHFTTNVNNAKEFLARLQENWETLFTNPNKALQYKDSSGNTLEMPSQQLWEGLALLTHQMKDNQGQMGYTYLDNQRNYPIKVGDQLYYIPGTYRQNGNILLMDTYNNRLVKSSIARYPDLQTSLGNALYEKEGGILKFAGGGQAEGDDNYTRFGVRSSSSSQQDTGTQGNLTASQQPAPQTTENTAPQIGEGNYLIIGSILGDLTSLGLATSKNPTMRKVSRYTNVASGIAGAVGETMNGTANWHTGLDLVSRIGAASPYGNMFRGAQTRSVLNKLADFTYANAGLMTYAIREAGTDGPGIKAALRKVLNGQFSDINSNDYVYIGRALSILASTRTANAQRAEYDVKKKSATNQHAIDTNGNAVEVTAQQIRDLRGNRHPTIESNGQQVELQTRRAMPATKSKPNATSYKVATYPYLTGESVEESWHANWDPGWWGAGRATRRTFQNVQSAAERQPNGILYPFGAPRLRRQGNLNNSTRPRREEDLNEQPSPSVIEPEPVILGQPEPEIQIPFRPQEPPAQPSVRPANQSQRRQNKGKGKKRRHELGGYFTFLRTGGVVKYQQGGLTGINSGQGYNWYNNVFSGYKQHILDGIGTQGYVDWLNTMQGNHANLHTAAGNDWKNVAYKDASVKTYQEAYLKGFEGYDTDNPYNKTGIGKAYATQGHYDFSGSNNRGTAEVNQGQFVGNPDGLYSQMTDDRRLLGREGDWTPEQLQEWNTALKAKGYIMELDPTDHYYRINPIDNSGQNVTGNDPDPNAEKVKPVQEEPADQEHENGLIVGNPQPQLKKPFDPRALFILGRGASTIFGNSWMYDRIYDRIPNPAYKDFIDRRLDTIGDYAYLAHAGNQAADLRAIQQLRQVSDQSLNLAADFESGRIGREAMDKAFLQDATKQATTHEAALQMDLKDVEDRRDVAWYNRVALNKYLSDRADVLNAKDKANLDATLGVVNNLTQLGASKYLEKKAAYDKAQATIMQQPLERAQERMRTQHAELYNKVANGTASDAEVAQYQQLLAQYLREARLAYATDFYSLYGGGVRYPKKQHGEAEVIARATPTNERTSTYTNPWEDPVNLDKKGGKLEFVKSLRQ